MSLRVGIVGCGRMGQIRAQSAQLWGASVSLLCDPNIEEHDLSAFDSAQRIRDYQDIMAGQMDVMFICTPPHLHSELMHLALDIGTPFLVEKPLGLHCAQLESVQRRIQKKPTLNAVGFMSRYRKSVELLLAELEKTTFLGLAMHWVNAAYKVPWWSQNALSGGPLNEQASHFMDLATLIGGPIRQVHVVSQPADPEDGGLGSASIQFSFESGIPGHLFYSCLAREKQIGLRVFSSSGDFFLENWDLNPHFVDLPQQTDRNAVFEKETKAFLSAVRDSDPTPIRCTFRDAFETQRVLDAINRSAHSGQMERVQP